MTRRRFLQIVAGAALVAQGARASTWQGQAFGADIAITAAGALPMAEIRAEIAAIEATFSLYAESEVTRLNAEGRGPGSDRLRAVLAVAKHVHDLTRGAFDPTVQPLWRALAEGRDPVQPRAAIGLHRMQVGRQIVLARGQAVTFNGIAQGQPITWEQDGEQYVSIISGWGGAVPLWGGEVAKRVNYLNQGGTVWTFRLPKQLASVN